MMSEQEREFKLWNCLGILLSFFRGWGFTSIVTILDREMPWSAMLKNDPNIFIILDTFADCFASILAM